MVHDISTDNPVEGASALYMGAIIHSQYDKSSQLTDNRLARQGIRPNPPTNC